MPHNVTAVLDYAFAWRWLLPELDEGSPRLIGFDAATERFWRRAGDRYGGLVIIEGDATSASFQLTGGRDRLWCVVVSRSAAIPWQRRLARKFSVVREYALLRPGNPRVVLPLLSTRVAKDGLSLHRPGGWLAVAAVAGARLLLSLGNRAALRSRVLLVASNEPSLQPAGAVGEAVGADAYALYLGAPTPHRKTVALPLSKTGPSGLILKTAVSPAAKRALLNEAKTLNALVHTSVAGSIPKLRFLQEKDDQLVLGQEYRARRHVFWRTLRAARVQFLANLSSYMRRELSGEQLRELPAIRSASKRLPDVQSVLMKIPVYWTHWTHGDFAPWNSSFTDQGFFVWDWEEGSADGFAFTDVFYHALAPLIHVRQSRDARWALRLALAEGRSFARIAGFPESAVKPHLTIFLLMRAQEQTLYAEMLKLTLLDD